MKTELLFQKRLVKGQKFICIRPSFQSDFFNSPLQWEVDFGKAERKRIAKCSVTESLALTNLLIFCRVLTDCTNNEGEKE